MRFKGLVLIFSVLLLLAGCGSKSGLSKDDIGIRKIDDRKAKVVYGMSQEDVEKVLGGGEKRGDGFGTKNSFTYDSGIKIAYRDEKVVSIVLDEGSSDVYETLKGARVGMIKNEIEKLYGENYLKESYERTLDYIYDTANKKFITDSNSSKELKVDNKTYMISSTFNSDGYAKTIMLLDREYGVYFR